MRDIIYNLVFLVLICLSSYISLEIPFSPIPFTAQSFIIFIIAGLVRPRTSGLLIVAYLLLGILGLPVFAEGSSGWAKISGTSGGFLYGFIMAAVFVSYFIHRIPKADLIKTMSVMIGGTIVLFIFGLGHLAIKFGIGKSLEYGFYPFWKMALLKAIGAAIFVYLLRRFLDHEAA